ncbi:MAG TPA: anti-phage defense protein ZorA, partial [Alphaproteobacteria bacterium]|nr:anti-phage defense protein ZorA [Alphaproteobacteria bacterium]
MLDRVLWNGWFRFIAFLVIFALTTILFDLLVPWLDLPWLWDHLVSVVRNFTYQSPTPWFGWGQHVAVAQLSSPGLATNLAWTIGAIGAGLLTGYLVMHVLVFLVSLRALRRRVKRYGTRREFAEAYDLAVHAYLQQHPLIGHAWKEFDETLLNGERRIDGAIGNTVRPQAFINLALIRERLPGLKLLPSISGYFVGAGLLLTFIGIVLALGIAAGSVESGNAEQMQIAMTRLLHTASFKFATSIAGLGVSILFAIFARLIVICVEGGLNRFCDAVEHQLLYVAPQFIAAESNRVVKEQLVELKELSSERYFSNFAQILEEAMQRTLGGISGRMEVAISGAATQVGRAVTEAIAPLTGGVADVIRENTGNELQQLGRTLAALEGALGNMQAGLDRLDTALGEAAAGASGRMEAAMEGVLKQLQQQVGVFLEGMRDQGDAAARELAGARQQAAAAQAEATAGITRAGQEAARALNEGLGNVLQRIEDSVNRLDNALQRSAEAHQAQAAAVNDSSAGAQRLAE